MRTLAVLILLAASPLPAQVVDEPPIADEETAAGVVRGTIVGEAGEPVSGALVDFSTESSRDARVARTDRDGRFLLARLPTGPGMLRVEAEGFVDGAAKVSVVADVEATVQLSLEIDPAPLIKSWLVAGNRSLESGDTERAREWFERALTVVPDTESADIARALARTYYLDARIDDAAQTLQGALINAPGDEATRQLYVALLDEAGRRGEAATWLEELDRAGARAGLASLRPRPLVELDGRPTGRFQTQLEAPSPLSTASGIGDRLGRFAESSSDVWDPSKETFEVYVPPGDAPPAGGYGLVVWISPNPMGAIPDREIVPELDRRGLIWIGANDSGNQRPALDRIRLALDGAAAVTSSYPVDARRVWAVGYSGGGRIASALVLHFSEMFAGGVLFMGSDFYEPVAAPHRSGSFWSPSFDPPTAEELDRIARDSRLVLATSEFDFNRFQTRANLAAMTSRGFRGVTYQEIPGVGHFYGFRADAFISAMAYLEGDTVTSGEFQQEEEGRR